MSRHPVKSPPRKTSTIIDANPVRDETAPFMNFSYGYKEISVRGGKATVRSRSTKLENGKLTSETFEGEAEASAYERLMASAQRHFIAQTALLFEPLAAFLPGRKRPSRRD